MTKLLLNGSNSVNYIVHGQELSLSFSFPEAKFVSIYYNQIPVSDKFKARPFWYWQRRKWFGNTGEFKAHYNVYHPFVRITIWSKWMLPKRIMIPLRVNHVKVNSILPTWDLQTPQSLEPLKTVSNGFNVALNIPKFHFFDTRIKFQTQPRPIQID